jgi:hypothetical protein
MKRVLVWLLEPRYSLVFLFFNVLFALWLSDNIRWWFE